MLSGSSREKTSATEALFSGRSSRAGKFPGSARGNGIPALPLSSDEAGTDGWERTLGQQVAILRGPAGPVCALSCWMTRHNAQRLT